jgi:hypothetical protein
MPPEKEMDESGKQQQPRHDDAHRNAGDEGQADSGKASQDQKNRYDDGHATGSMDGLRRKRGCHGCLQQRQGDRLRRRLMRCKQFSGAYSVITPFAPGLK